MQGVTDLEKQIRTLEEELLQKKKQLAGLKKRLPEKKVRDYELKGLDGEPVLLSDLFKDSNELFVVHNMGKSCSYCTMWADGFNGVHPHIEKRAAFVISSPDSPNVMKEVKDRRGWAFSMVSTAGTTFKQDLGFESENGQLHPGVSVFRKDAEENVYYHNQAPFGPGDDFCSVWHFYDLLRSVE